MKDKESVNNRQQSKRRSIEKTKQDAIDDIIVPDTQTGKEDYRKKC